MAKRRPAGDGMVRRRDDGRWEGRIVIGHRENGEPLFRHVYAKHICLAHCKRRWRVRWVCSVTGWAGCYLSWRWSTT